MLRSVLHIDGKNEKIIYDNSIDDKNQDQNSGISCNSKNRRKRT